MEEGYSTFPLEKHNKLKCNRIIQSRKCRYIFIALLITTISCAIISSYFWTNVTNQPESIKSTRAFIRTADAESDLVIDLPGLAGLTETNGEIVSYAGYVDALEDREIFYWFVEAQNDPDTAPLLIWTNGGPGCSGLIGLFTEMGPFWAKEDCGLVYNPSSWTTIANMVFFEIPYGVGFSTKDADKDFVIGDEVTIIDYDAAIRSFLRKFPEFETRDTYLVAESFGGHYMPLTSIQILEHNELGAEPQVNLLGFLVGNPYTNVYENYMGWVMSMYGHGLFPEQLAELWRETCWDDEHELEGLFCYTLYLYSYYFAINTDVYALDWDDCIGDMIWPSSSEYKTEDQAYYPRRKLMKGLIAHKQFQRAADVVLTKYDNDDDYNMFIETEMRPMMKHNKNIGFPKLSEISDLLRTLKNSFDHDYTKDLLDEKQTNKANVNDRKLLNLESEFYYSPCDDVDTVVYLNNEEVQSAIHAKTQKWTMCNYHIFESWPDYDWENKMQSYYAEIIEKWPLFKMGIVSGDDDAVCATHGTQYWLDRMTEFGWHYDHKAEDNWYVWESDVSGSKQIGGYYTQYLTSEDNRALHFITVRSAGRMIASFQPTRSLEVLQKYLFEWD